jgi:hypothetical protein
MTKPFCYLKNIPFFLKEWRHLITDFDKQQSYHDQKALLLEDITRNFFLKNNLIPYFGLLWSWPKESTMTYHVDAAINDKGVVHVNDYSSINFLLDGDGAVTEFVSIENSTEIGKIQYSNIMNLPYRKFEDTEPDYKSYISYDNPLMINTQIPHRVNTKGITNTRWSYSLRFGNKENNVFRKVRFEELKLLLSEYILEE